MLLLNSVPSSTLAELELGNGMVSGTQITYLDKVGHITILENPFLFP